MRLSRGLSFLGLRDGRAGSFKERTMNVDRLRMLRSMFLTALTDSDLQAALVQGGMDVGELIDEGKLVLQADGWQTVADTFLTSARQRLDPSLAEFSYRSLFMYVAESISNHPNIHGMQFTKCEGITLGSTTSASFPTRKKYYAAFCGQLAEIVDPLAAPEQHIPLAVTNPDPPLFRTSEAMRAWFRRSNRAISKKHLQETLIANLSDVDKRPVANDKRGTWEFNVDAAVKYMQGTTWEYEPNASKK
jgi:hypothetical protein